MSLIARAKAARAQLFGAGPGATLARGGGTALWIRVVGLTLVLAAQALLARLLGVEQYGVYAYALSCLTVLAVVCTVGFDSSSLRFVAEYRARSEWGLLRGFLRRSSRTTLVCSTSVALVAATVVGAFAGRLDAQLRYTFLIACFVLPAHVLLQMSSSTLRALKQVARAQVPVDIARPMLLVSAFWIFCVVYDGTPQAVHGMAATLLAVLAALAMAQISLRRVIVSTIPEAEPLDRSREWFSVALPLLLFTGFYLLLAQIDILMLGVLMNTTEAGVYSVASRLANLIPLGLAAVNTIAAPMIAGYYGQGDRKRLQRVLRIAAWMIAAAAIPAVLVLVLAGRSLLALFGSEFTGAYGALLVLAGGQLVNALSGSVGFVMTMTGHHVQATKILAWAVPLNLLLNLALIPRYGIIGAATATALTTVAWNLTMVVYVRRRQGLDTTLLGAIGDGRGR